MCLCDKAKRLTGAHGHAAGYRAASTMRVASRSPMLWHGGTPPCQLTEDTDRRTPISSGVGCAAVGAVRPPAGRVTGTTALLAEAAGVSAISALQRTG